MKIPQASIDHSFNSIDHSFKLQPEYSLTQFNLHPINSWFQYAGLSYGF
jgi:hypothetical protein